MNIQNSRNISEMWMPVKYTMCGKWHPVAIHKIYEQNIFNKREGKK